MVRILPVALLVAACGQNLSDGDDTDTIDCGSTAPTIDGDVVLTDLGVVEFKGEDRHMIQIQAQADDADGDLHRHTVQIWYDTLIDGSLREQPDAQVTNTNFEDSPCEIDGLTVGAVLPLGEDDVPPNVDVEFGFRVLDAAGNATNGGEPLVIEWTTPEL